MFRNLFLCLTLLCLPLSPSALGESPRESFRLELLDDAALHDVEFVGQAGWAVGDHGTVRRTSDGGRTWTTEHAPVSASLRSVCFLTDRIGWIAGGDVEPLTQAARGVLLFTKDGGERWERLDANALPFLFPRLL